jgi:hypothetical protein
VLETLDSKDPDELVAWVSRELRKVQAALETGLMRHVEFLNVEPAKPREGMIRGADGTNWDPGGGTGVYAYYDSTWNKLG